MSLPGETDEMVFLTCRSSVVSSTGVGDSAAFAPPVCVPAAKTSNPMPSATQTGGADAAAAGGAASGQPAAKGDGSTPTILVVDDDTGQRLMLKAVN
jgi:hypothetical protein